MHNTIVGNKLQEKEILILTLYGIKGNCLERRIAYSLEPLFFFQKEFFKCIAVIGWSILASWD